jgi:hypothetical protein
MSIHLVTPDGLEERTDFYASALTVYDEPVHEDLEDDDFCSKCAQHAGQLSRLDYERRLVQEKAEREIRRLQKALMDIYVIAKDCGTERLAMAAALGRIYGAAQFHGEYVKVDLT